MSGMTVKKQKKSYGVGAAPEVSRSRIAACRMEPSRRPASQRESVDGRALLISGVTETKSLTVEVPMAGIQQWSSSTRSITSSVGFMRIMSLEYVPKSSGIVGGMGNVVGPIKG